MMDDKRFRNGADQQDSYAKIWRFQLTEAMTVGNAATAKRLDWSGTTLAESTDTLELYAPLLDYPLADDTQGYAIFNRDAGRWEVLHVIGAGVILVKTDASHAKSATGTCSIYFDTSTDSGDSITATNLYADLASGSWAHAAKWGGVWYLIAGEC